MKWRGLICSPESVRAYLAGTKTQTRRVVTHQPEQDDPKRWVIRTGRKSTLTLWSEDEYRKVAPAFCSHGVPGDGLYVSEAIEFQTISPTVVGITYLADRTQANCPLPGRVKHPQMGRYRGRVIPHEWARIFRELVEVRVERVQSIGVKDAIAEGIEPPIKHKSQRWDWWDYELKRWTNFCGGCEIDSYRTWWDSLNGKRGHGWDTNPWVWVETTQETEQRP